MHIFNVSITTVQGLKGVGGVDYTKWCHLFKTCWKNDQVQLHVNFTKNVRTLSKSHMHIFNVSITTVQGLKNVSLKLWEQLITQSRYPIKDARPPVIHDSIRLICTLCNPAKKSSNYLNRCCCLVVVLLLSKREVVSSSPARVCSCVKPKTSKIGSDCFFAKITAFRRWNRGSFEYDQQRSRVAVGVACKRTLTVKSRKR